MFSTNGHTTHQLVIVQAHDPMTMTQRLIVDPDKKKLYEVHCQQLYHEETSCRDTIHKEI
jgi:hypothetical protein